MNKLKLMLLLTLSSTLIIGCDVANGTSQDKNKLANDIVKSMIYVKGGRFQMGDFGPLVGERLPFSPDRNNKPLHFVELSDFKITKNKITWAEFNKWLALNGKEQNKYFKWASRKETSERFRKPTGDDYPASVNWNAANEFCQWIGKKNWEIYHLAY